MLATRRCAKTRGPVRRLFDGRHAFFRSAEPMSTTDHGDKISNDSIGWLRGEARLGTGAEAWASRPWLGVWSATWSGSPHRPRHEWRPATARRMTR